MILCKKPFLFCCVLLFCAIFNNIFAQYVSVFPKNQENIDSVKIEISALPSNINSHFSEYCAILLKDSTFIFSSMRNDAAEDSEHFFETNWYCYIYTSKLLPDNRYQKPQPLPRNINNHEYFNSNFTINEDGDKMIFSRCERYGDGDLKCSLFSSERVKKGWSKPKKLNNQINFDGYSSLQPHFVKTDDYEVLYFVSDRPGGFGNLDIWYSICKNGEFQSPINAGSTINTIGNEITPFYDVNRKVLFFSTDERKGFGDYDIWCSKGALSGWQTPELLSKPFNSEYNDIYFSLNPDGNSAYLSSNRLYDNMIEDTCCNDIYKIDWKFYKSDSSNIIDKEPSIQEKIASVLPISLYFQNDSPDPRSLSDTTKTDYSELCNAYIADIQKYIHSSGEGLQGDEQRRAMYEVAAFMRDSVQTGYNRLILLTQYLKEATEHNEQVNLIIQGFASPLHNEIYNQHLSKRRIISLINYLKKAENAIFEQYLGDNRLINIEIKPEGAIKHEFSTEKVRETVFGLQAAKDRKIVISGY